MGETFRAPYVCGQRSPRGPRCSFSKATSKATIIPLWLAAALLGGCEEPNRYVPPPPPTVTVAAPLVETVTDYLEFTGTTEAVASVEVRARVAGFLTRVNFTPGTRVAKGELLFEIDPREYQAAVAEAAAQLEAARAELERAEVELKRAERLFKQNAGSEADVVKWRGDRDVARAAIARAQAKLERARLDLGYTGVTAPISGRVGRNLVDAGNLVGEGEPTLLTTVTDFDPMYAYFTLNERDLLRVMELYRETVKEKEIAIDEVSAAEADIPVYLGLANEEGYPHEGEIDFAETGVDPSTGTLQLRGVFPNPELPAVLLPGLFARLRMPVQERSDALLVTERAIGSDQAGRYVLVVNSEDVVERRPIRQGQLVDGLRVVLEGLTARDRVIVRGVQRARPGVEVNPEEVDMASLRTSALAAAAPATPEPSPSPANAEG